MFECHASKGAKKYKCRELRNYDDFKEHVKKHHKLNNYKCRLEKCNHKKGYASLDELSTHHW